MRGLTVCRSLYMLYRLRLEQRVPFWWATERARRPRGPARRGARGAMQVFLPCTTRTRARVLF
eukprot:COSAG06_NODE_5802_length_3266_cov_15.801705_2_plen_63_part_00